MIDYYVIQTWRHNDSEPILAWKSGDPIPVERVTWTFEKDQPGKIFLDSQEIEHGELWVDDILVASVPGIRGLKK